MPRPIGRTSHGTTILQDDGTYLFLPHETEQSAAGVSTAAPPPAPVPSRGRAVQQPDGTHLFLPDDIGPAPVATSSALPGPIDAESARPQDAPTLDQITASPVPDIARDAVAADINAGTIPLPGAAGAPGAVNMPAEDIAADGSVPLSPEEAAIAQQSAGEYAATQPGAGMTPEETAANDAAVAGDLGRSDVDTGGQPDAAQDAAAGSPPDTAADAAAPVAKDPYEQAGEEALAAGVMADNAAQEQAARDQVRNDAVAKIEADKAAAVQRQLARREELVTAFDKATQRQADFDMRTPGKGVPQKIVDGIAIMLGALGQGLSGQNPADNPVMKQLDAEVEQAAQDRARQYGKLSADTQGIASTIDQHDRLSTSQAAAFEAAKAVEWDKAARETERQATLLGGKEALQNAKQAQQSMLQKRDAAYQAAADKQADNEREDKKVAIDAFKANNQVIKDQQDAAVAAMNARTNAWQASIASRAQTQHATEFDKMEGQRAADLAKTYAETQKLLREAEASGKGDPQMLRFEMDFQNKRMARGLAPRIESKLIQGPDGTSHIEETPVPLTNLPDVIIDPLTSQPITGPDGKPIKVAQEFMAPTEEEGQKLRQKQAAVTTLVKTIDKMEAVIRKNGWSSDTLKSPEWREAQSLMAKAQLTVKDVEHLGVLAGPDMGLIEKLLGTADPTEIRQDGILKGLQTARGSAIDGFNNDMTGAGYTGTVKFDVPNANELPGGVLSPEGLAAERFAADKGSKRSGYGTSDPLLKSTDYLSGNQVQQIIALHALSRMPGHETAALTTLAKLAKESPARGAIRTYLAQHDIDLTPVDEELGQKINDRAAYFKTADDPAERAVNQSLDIPALAKQAVVKIRPDIVANQAIQEAAAAKKKQ